MRCLSFIAALVSCALVVLAWSSSPQSKDAVSQSGTTDLNQLLRDRRYLELNAALSSKSNLSLSDRTFFEGVMANRRNRVADSIKMLEPLAQSLSTVDKDRASYDPDAHWLTTMKSLSATRMRRIPTRNWIDALDW